MGDGGGYTIDKISWHTQVDGNPELPHEVIARFKVIAAFLQDNGLVTRSLLVDGVEPDENFSIHTSDLTDDGVRVMKAGYDRWLKRVVNKRKSINDVSILRHALSEVRKA